MKKSISNSFVPILMFLALSLPACNIIPGQNAAPANRIDPSQEWILGAWQTDLNQDEYIRFEFVDNGKMVVTQYFIPSGETGFQRESIEISDFVITKDDVLELYSYFDRETWNFEITYLPSQEILKLESATPDADIGPFVLTRVGNSKSTTIRIDKDLLLGSWQLAETTEDNGLYLEFSNDEQVYFWRNYEGQVVEAEELTFSLPSPSQIQLSPGLWESDSYEIFATSKDRIILYHYEYREDGSVSAAVLEMYRVE